MLEDLMLLEGGRLAYFGTTECARTFFDSVAEPCPLTANPAGGCGAVRFGAMRAYAVEHGIVGTVVSVSQSGGEPVSHRGAHLCGVCVCSWEPAAGSGMQL